MATNTYISDFWRWYFSSKWTEFDGVETNQKTINNVENLFNTTEKVYNLIINLEDGVCYDAENEYRIQEYIALRLDATINSVEQDLEIEYERWLGTQRIKSERMKYRRNVEGYCWETKINSDTWAPVTDFDIILESIIERFNIKTQEWERYYEGNLRYMKMGRVVVKEFKFNPDEIHSKTEFSKAVWKKDFLQLINIKDDEVRDLWAHIDHFYTPRVVREFNHSGFIEFDKKKYFLAENVLIKFPTKKGEVLELVAETNGAFKVEQNKYVKSPETASHLPFFSLGARDTKTNLYQQKMANLMNDTTFLEKYRQVEDKFCSTIGGDSEFRNWGKLVMAYTFSYFFLDDIYKHFSHVIFLYLFGDGNVGKGEIAKRILDFYGINHLDSLNTPKARNVDTALEQKSLIPVWIDEHVPEGVIKNTQIPDQTWNSWFELKQRQTNIQSGGSWVTERKEVRTMPLFCSNYKPRTDHLLSRSLILEYKKSTRGPEKHLRWLINHKELLQLLTLSFMQNYNLMNRNVFIWDLSRLRDRLKEDVRVNLEQQKTDAIIQDRQIAQFASLLTVHHWVDADYRKQIEVLATKYSDLHTETNATHKEIRQGEINKELDQILDLELYNFVKNEIIRTAIVAAQHDPLTDYIETIGTLIQSGKINEYHFNWTREGHLKIWAKAVWDEYEALKRGTDDMVRRDVVDAKLMDLSKIGKNGTLPTLNWSLDGVNSIQRQKGFYIEDAYAMDLFSINFKYDKYCTGGPRIPTHNDGETGNNTDTNKTPNLDDDLPF